MSLITHRIARNLCLERNQERGNKVTMAMANFMPLSLILVPKTVGYPYTVSIEM
jgi:hypothetical protein